MPERQTLKTQNKPHGQSRSNEDIELTKIELSEGNIQQLKIQADMLVEQGDLDETQSLYDEALTAYNDALEIYSKVYSKMGLEESLKVYLRIANIHYHVGNVELSRKGCIDALTLAESNRLMTSESQSGCTCSNW